MPRLISAAAHNGARTVLAQLLYAYLLSVKWCNVGYFLPDDDLVAGLVDTKFRPDVVDQIDWFAELIQIGKAINKIRPCR